MADGERPETYMLTILGPMRQYVNHNLLFTENYLGYLFCGATINGQFITIGRGEPHT
jgi:hypothetical protein